MSATCRMQIQNNRRLSYFIQTEDCIQVLIETKIIDKNTGKAREHSCEREISFRKMIYFHSYGYNV